MTFSFSFIIPVYNRPEEVRELFDSLLSQTYEGSYEVVLIEDGSERTALDVVEEFQTRLNIVYLVKENSGPGDSRNYGMKRAGGDYFLILDSDCILPENYLENVSKALEAEYVHCFGGPDTAHKSFSNLQHAINYAMTSFLTTGGIRGDKRAARNFQPRSFNMGLSAMAFSSSGGFGNIHPGEDPDLSIRLKKMGFSIRLIPEAVVYHKRRISFASFFRQVRKFGLVRPILNQWHPETKKVTYWFPTFFIIGLVVSIGLMFVDEFWPIGLYLLYFTVIFIDALIRTGKIIVALMAVYAVLIQFTGYGFGFLKSFILVNFSKKNPRQVFPELFYEPI